MGERAKQNSKKTTLSPLPAFQAIHPFNPIQVLILHSSYLTLSLTLLYFSLSTSHFKTGMEREAWPIQLCKLWGHCFSQQDVQSVSLG